mgnify:CR=1 FL=1
MWMWMRRLMYGCWGAHRHMVRERQGEAYMLVCETCGSAKPMIPADK